MQANDGGDPSVQVTTSMIDSRHVHSAVAELLRSFPSSIRFFGARASLRLAARTMQSLTKVAIDRQHAKSPFLEQGAPDLCEVTLLTFTIHPDLARVWYRFASKGVAGHSVRVVIVDCCGRIDPTLFSGALVVPFWNYSHSRKVDYFLRYAIATPHVWLCDDDVMLTNPAVLARVKDLFTTRTDLACVSLAPRGWSLSVGAHSTRAMGSYCIVFDRRVIIREGLSFSPAKSPNPGVGRIAGYYDTADYANEQLLRRGYGIEIIGENQDPPNTCGFVGTSVAYLGMRRGLKQQLAEIAKLSVDKPTVAVHRLVGIYCNWRVVDLYRKAFQAEPLWRPTIIESQLGQLIAALPDAQQEEARRLFQRYEQRYQYLASMI